jgi:glycerate kinase
MPVSRPLTVIVAPDSFGGALDAVAAADAIRRGWLSVRSDDEVRLRPMADGGEGTLNALVAGLGDGVERRTTASTDPLGRPINAEWLWLGPDTAVIEFSSAAGLARLTPAERTPESALAASSRGVGQIVRAALDAGAQRIILGLGGSGTTDGGSGLLVELGLRLNDATRSTVAPDGGAALAGVFAVDASGLDPRLAEIELTIASDVTAPLTGPRGAARVYGPQKGADPAAVAVLDAALARWGAALEESTDRAVAGIPGAGAAGGAAAGLLALTNAELRMGAEIVSDLIGLAEACADADLVITGEGRADEQTLSGKTALGVSKVARPRPVVLLCGALGIGAEVLAESGAFDLVQPIAEGPMELADAMADTERLLSNAASRLAQAVGLGQLLG